MAFQYSLRVRYAEVDSQGVVFNANWLLYADEAITRFVEHLGYDPSAMWGTGDDREFDIMVRHTALDFLGPARFEDTVTISVVATRLGRSSFDVSMRAEVDGRHAVTIDSTYVVVDAQAYTPIPMPDRLRTALTAELVEEPADA